MKVKVTTIKSPYTNVPTPSLQAVLCNHAHNRLLVHVGTEQLYAIMGELANRRDPSDYYYKTNEEALTVFRHRYLKPEDE